MSGGQSLVGAYLHVHFPGNDLHKVFAMTFTVPWTLDGMFDDDPCMIDWHIEHGYF